MTIAFTTNRYTCTYSGDKKNPDLSIKSTENVHMIYRHCKRLIISSTDAVLCLYSPLCEITVPISFIRCCGLNFPHF